MKALVALSTLVLLQTGAIGAALPASPYVGPFKSENCPAIVRMFDDPTPLFLAVVRNQPRQADDFVRNYGRCVFSGTNSVNGLLTGWLKTTPRSCEVLADVAAWLHDHDVNLTGRAKPALMWGYYGTTAGNSADFANNANDCIRMLGDPMDAEADDESPEQPAAPMPNAPVTAASMFGKRWW